MEFLDSDRIRTRKIRISDDETKRSKDVLLVEVISKL